jgi:hypothetical protein
LPDIRSRRDLGPFGAVSLHHVRQIEHDLRCCAGHQSYWRRSSEMNALHCVLDGHRRHPHHAGQDGLP